MKSLIMFILGMTLIVSPSLAQTPAEREASLKGNLPYKVAILPVTIHSPENLGFMRDGLVDILSSRVELEGKVAVLEKGPVKRALAEFQGEITQEKAGKIGAALGADFVVFGSLTKLGDSASLDLKVVQVKGDKPASPVFVRAKKMEEIIAGADDLARQIDEKILGYPLKPQAPEKPAVAGKEKEISGFPAIPAVSGPGKTVRTPAESEFWQSQPFSFTIKGMAVGDFDGDGRNEVAVIAERNLYVYRWENTEFKLLRKFDGGKFDQYLAVDAADTDKDGKAEIFVTNIQEYRLSSFVVAFKDGALRKVAAGLEWFFRVVEWGEKGAVLLGQRRGHEEGFEWPIYEMGWDGKKVKDLRKADIPKVGSLYGFAPFMRDGRKGFLAIDSDFRLRLMDEKGKTVWKSGDDYGSNNEFQVKPLVVGPGQRFEDAGETAFVNIRVIPMKSDIVAIRNISVTGQFLTRTKAYTKGEVQVLTWNGAMFMTGWKSREIPGYLADFQIRDVDGEKGSELIIAVNLPREGLLPGQMGSALMISRVEGIQ